MLASEFMDMYERLTQEHEAALDAGFTLEPIRVGNTYQTNNGKLVKMVGYGSGLAGTCYETMFDQYGMHRYTNRKHLCEYGRCTGTELNDSGDNLVPLWRKI